jgi:hypothetical protein
MATWGPIVVMVLGLELAACSGGQSSGYYYGAYGGSGSTEPNSSGGTDGGVVLCKEPRSAGTPCFTPCGGDPFGTWTLDTACWQERAATAIPFITDLSNSSSFSLQIEEGGTLRVAGDEFWSFRGFTYSPNGDGVCPNVSLETAGLLLFGTSGSDHSDCSGDPCLTCTCEASALNSMDWQGGRWSRSGTELQLAESSSASSFSVPYCVNGDEMWIGGGGTVAYRLRKGVCVGTPAPCAARNPDQCSLGDGCSLGACEPTASGSATVCQGASTAANCSTYANCLWNANACRGTPPDDCSWQNCNVPGCEFVSPNATCTGAATPCTGRATSGCRGELGCYPGVCTKPTNRTSYDMCGLLQRNSLCQLAPGCTWDVTSCSGTTSCTAQVDPEPCSVLSCDWTAGCTGNALPCGLVPLALCEQAGCTLNR